VVSVLTKSHNQCGLIKKQTNNEGGSNIYTVL